MKYGEMIKEAEKVGGCINLTPTFMDWQKKGDRVVGRLKGMADVKSTLGPGTYKHYLFETDTGLVKFALGAATDAEAVPLFTLEKVYIIEFQGKEKIKGGRSVNKFKILHIDEGSIPGSAR